MMASFLDVKTSVRIMFVNFLLQVVRFLNYVRIMFVLIFFG